MYRMGNVINKVAATKLFDDNSCLVGDRDVIFESVARELLGGESIEFAKRMCTKTERRFNGYGIGDYTACYLTQKEFFLAITYLNVKKQRDLGNQKKMDIDMQNHDRERRLYEYYTYFPHRRPPAILEAITSKTTK